MDGVLILNKWPMPSSDGFMWIIFAIVCFVIGLIAFMCDSERVGFGSWILASVLMACFFLPFTNRWVSRYEIALNGATYEELTDYYDVLSINGGIFTVEDK